MKTILDIFNEVGSFARRVGTLAEQTSAAARRAASTVQRGMDAIAAWQRRVGPAIGRALEFLDEALPVLQEALERAQQEMQGGQQVIRDAGFGFTVYDMPWHVVFHANRLHPRTARATITKSMVRVTRSPEFVRTLCNLYTQSPTLLSHWPAMEQAIDNHLRRQYYSSVTALLPRVEGVLADGLEMEGRIRTQNAKRIAMDNGQDKLGKDGKPVKLAGMDALARQAAFPTQDALTEAVALVADRVAPERNLILHGQLRRYGTAGRSARALLLLAFLGAWVVGLERGRVRPT